MEVNPGLKYDQEKPMWYLIPLDVISGVVKVLTFGAKKYSADSWQNVETERYFAAGNRHLEYIAYGEEYDGESNLHHAFHYCCNSIFITWKLIRGDNQWLKNMYGIREINLKEEGELIDHRFTEVYSYFKIC